jgi:hypothetical protein
VRLCEGFADAFFALGEGSSPGDAGAHKLSTKIERASIFFTEEELRLEPAAEAVMPRGVEPHVVGVLHPAWQE